MEEEQETGWQQSDESDFDGDDDGDDDDHNRAGPSQPKKKRTNI